MAKQRTYKVQEGDTYFGLAGQFFGDQRLGSDIAYANQDRMLHAGMEILIPDFPDEYSPFISQYRAEELAGSTHFTQDPSQRSTDLSQVMGYGSTVLGLDTGLVPGISEGMGGGVSANLNVLDPEQIIADTQAALMPDTELIPYGPFVLQGPGDTRNIPEGLPAMSGGEKGERSAIGDDPYGTGTPGVTATPPGYEGFTQSGPIYSATEGGAGGAPGLTRDLFPEGHYGDIMFNKELERIDMIRSFNDLMEAESTRHINIRTLNELMEGESGIPQAFYNEEVQKNADRELSFGGKKLQRPMTAADMELRREIIIDAKIFGMGISAYADTGNRDMLPLTVSWGSLAYLGIPPDQRMEFLTGDPNDPNDFGLGYVMMPGGDLATGGVIFIRQDNVPALLSGSYSGGGSSGLGYWDWSPSGGGTSGYGGQKYSSRPSVPGSGGVTWRI